MNIVVDLDDTLFESNVIMDVVNKYRLPFQRSDIKTWELFELPEYCRVEVRKRWNQQKHMCRLIPCEDAVETINTWSNNGHHLYCVTSRSKKIEKETKKMVSHWFPTIKNTYVVEGSKVEILKELKPDLFIDDGGHHMLDALQLNINVVLISNKHTPYNHDYRSYIPWKPRIADIKLEEIITVR